MGDSHHHRSGALKQSHKQHKGAHASKGAVKRAAGAGRTGGKAASGGLSVKAGSEAGSKAARVQRAKQLRAAARAELIQGKRRAKRGGAEGAPLLVHFVPLDESVDLRALAASVCDDEEAANELRWGVEKLGVRSDRGLHFLGAPHGDMLANLDAAAIADVVVLVMAGSPLVGDEMDDDDDDAATTRTGMTTIGASIGDACSPEALEVISALKALGAPTLLGLVLPSGSRKLQRRRMRLARRFFGSEFGDPVSHVEATVDLGDPEPLLRLITTAKRKVPTWRRDRSTVLAASATVDNETLSVTGWVRGAELSARRLVHVGGLGALRVERLEILSSSKGGEDEVVFTILPDREAEPLVMEATPDGLAGEQTWPTEDDEEMLLDDDDDNQSVKSTKSTKSQGGKRRAMMSEYQSAWGLAMDDDDDAAPDDDLDDDDDDDDDDDEDLDECDMNNERIALKRSAAAEDAQFPDEVELDEDAEGRVRFARYRALPSVRNSKWDPLESLPREYAHVHNLARFEHARKRAIREAGAQGITTSTMMMVAERPDGEKRCAVGARVRVVLTGLASQEKLQEAADSINKARGAKAVVSLHKHENRLTVAHYAVRPVVTSSVQDDEDEEIKIEPLASKDMLTVRCGHREWKAKPIFSTHNLNSDKHQYLRFCREHCVASAYGPVTFAPAPAFFFDKMNKLVAVGHALDCDPNRIVLKRAVLTGVPVRTHKRKATIKGMFYNPEDAKYFKPAQLHTKHGLTANITDSIGTHGLFKVSLSRPMKQSDTMMLSLYKRVFPKFVDSQDEVDNFVTNNSTNPAASEGGGKKGLLLVT